MRTSIYALSVLAVLAVASTAAAQEDARYAEARARYAEVMQRYDVGDFEGALAEFIHIPSQLQIPCRLTKDLTPPRTKDLAREPAPLRVSF